MTISAKRGQPGTRLHLELLEGRALMASNLLSSVAQPLVATAVPMIALSPAINVAELDNLAVRLDGVETAQVQNAQDRFVTEAFGGQVQGVVGSQLDQLKDMGSSQSKNPLHNLGNKMSELISPKSGQVSEDEKKDGEIDWGEFFETIVEEVFTAPAKRFSLLAAPLFGAKEAADVTGDPKDFVNGVKAVSDPVNSRNGAEHLKADDTFTPGGNAGTPNPEAPSDSPPVITAETLRGLAARLGGASTPTGDEATSGGPVNFHAIPLGTKGQWAPDMVGTPQSELTRVELDGLRVRLEAKINIIR